MIMQSTINNQQSECARNKKIDQIKGFSILGVIYIHVTELFGFSNSYLHDVTYLLSRLAVPYFIILFCCFFEKKLIKDNRAIVYVIRFYTLLIPFLFWSMIYFFIAFNSSSVAVSLIKVITTYWSGYGWSGQYFFILLFQVILLFPLFRVFATHKKIRSLALLMTAFFCIYNTYFYHLIPIVITKVSDRLIIYWLPYILLGILMAHNTQRVCKSKWLFLTVILIPFEYVLDSTANYSGSPYLRISVLIVAYITLPALISLPSEIKGRFGRIISLFGINSMALFILNPLIIIFLKKIDISKLSFENQELNYILSVVVCFFVASLACCLSSCLRGSFSKWII